jgi:arsenate reductase (glutaredoxin)
MVIHGLSTCGTCREARKALPQAMFRDLRAVPPTQAEVARWLEALGDRLVNRSSTTWRGLSDAQNAMPVAELLATWPTLIKRPLIDMDAPGGNGALHLGWTPATRAALGV